MPKFREEPSGRLAFRCPGCKDIHTIGRGWEFNGDLDNPTVTPSILLMAGHHSPDYEPGDMCWCTYNASRPDKKPAFICVRCHSIVTYGKIRFLDECSHELAGLTVDLPAIGKQ